MKQQNNINRRDFLSKSTMAGLGLSITMGAPGILGLSPMTANSKSTSKMNNSILGKRKLGSLEVTELGFGCMNIAGPTAIHQLRKMPFN
jgi:hypothetical protein